MDNIMQRNLYALSLLSTILLVTSCNFDILTKGTSNIEGEFSYTIDTGLQEEHASSKVIGSVKRNDSLSRYYLDEIHVSPIGGQSINDILLHFNASVSATMSIPSNQNTLATSNTENDTRSTTKYILSLPDGSSDELEQLQELGEHFALSGNHTFSSIRSASTFKRALEAKRKFSGSLSDAGINIINNEIDIHITE